MTIISVFLVLYYIGKLRFIFVDIELDMLPYFIVVYLITAFKTYFEKVIKDEHQDRIYDLKAVI